MKHLQQKSLNVRTYISTTAHDDAESEKGNHLMQPGNCREAYQITEALIWLCHLPDVEGVADSSPRTDLLTWPVAQLLEGSLWPKSGSAI